MPVTKIKDILDIFRLSYGGDGKVVRTEIVDGSKVSHISDPSKPVLPWHTYVGQKVPPETLAQIKEVRAMILGFDPKFQVVDPLKAPFISTHCDTSKCFFFAEQGDPTGYVKKLVAELDAEAQGIKTTMDHEVDEVAKTALRIDYMKTMAFKHLMDHREGPSSAINTYDSVTVTWGMGWALTGFLPQVFSAIYEIEKRTQDLERHYVQKLFYLCGFMYDDHRYYVVDTTEETVLMSDLGARPKAKSGDPIPDEPAIRVIHDTLELHIMWTQAARDDLTRATIVDAQMVTFKKYTGLVPRAEKIQTAALYTFIAHLQHWTGNKFDVVEWAMRPDARPKLTEPLPSERGDAQLAIQAVRCFYARFSPTGAPFTDARKYWGQMIHEDTKDEKLTEFKPDYPMMTAGPVTSVPEGNLSAEFVTKAGTTRYDLGPLEDFDRVPPSHADPTASMNYFPNSVDVTSTPAEEDPAEEDRLRVEQQAREERSSWWKVVFW